MRGALGLLDYASGGRLGSFVRYSRAVGISQTARFAVCEVLKIRRTFDVRFARVTLRCRTCSTDLRVAVECLSDREYDAVECNNPSVIFDLGAYIGASTAFFATEYPDALVVAVEPEAGNFVLLQENMRGYANVRILRAAVWGESGFREVRDSFTGPWGYTICDSPNRSETLHQTVECVTVGDLMERFRVAKIDVLKLDVEGAEKSVFENARGWIDKVQIIAVELHDRIVMGCERAFYLATADFARFKRSSDMVIAYNKVAERVIRVNPPGCTANSHSLSLVAHERGAAAFADQARPSQILTTQNDQGDGPPRAR
jgi:FkbM family methyltransferase